MWKSDVSQAYQRMPMHKHWQMKQIHTIKGERHVDCCNNFGGKGGYSIWSTFMSLVMWISWNILLIHFFVYVDDNFGFECAEALMFHARLSCRLPSQQACLLDLWDDIGLPYEDRKQEFGPMLHIIGFVVDPNAMTVTIPDDARANSCLPFWTLLISPTPTTIAHFMNSKPLLVMQIGPSMCSSRSPRPLYTVQQNSRQNESKCPHLPKFRHHSRINLAFRLHFSCAPVPIFSATPWDPVEARSAGLHQLEVFTDASSIALAYYFPALGLAYHAHLPPNPQLTPFFGMRLSPSALLSTMRQTFGHVTSPQNSIGCWLVPTT